jgi:hypothetical protein
MISSSAITRLTTTARGDNAKSVVRSIKKLISLIITNVILMGKMDCEAH